MLNSWPVLSYGLEHFDQRISDKSQLRSLVQTKLLRGWQAVPNYGFFWSNCVEHNCPRRVETYVLLANFSRDFIFCQWEPKNKARNDSVPRCGVVIGPLCATYLF